MKYILIILLMATFVIAQDQNFEELDKKNKEELGQEGVFVTRPLPKWSITKEVNTIEKSLSKYDPLIQALEEANNDLKNDLAEYLKNPNEQVLGAKITMKMSKYAKKIVGNVDTIISDQDVLLSV